MSDSITITNGKIPSYGKGSMSIANLNGENKYTLSRLPSNALDAPQKDFTNTIYKFMSQINQGQNNNELDTVFLPNDAVDEENTLPLFGILNPGMNATFDSRYKYIAVSGSDINSTPEQLIVEPATLTAQNTTADDNVTILGGSQVGFSYTADKESGSIYNTTGTFNFNGEGKAGNWIIDTAEGDANIVTTTGKNTINIEDGQAIIKSFGQDNISVNTVNFGSIYNSQITLAGENSTVSAGQGSSIIDAGINNHIATAQATTVNAGAYGTITFAGTNNDTSNSNTVQGGSGNTITSTNTDVTAIHGHDNVYTDIDQNLVLLNGTGDTHVSISKQFIGFGADDLNLTLSSNNTDQTFTGGSLFIADQGNETLTASGYNNAIAIYANTVSGAQTNFVATGGAGDDILAAGTGNSTFTGGAGNNLFAFTKESVSNGNTTITDFTAQNSNNHIGLYNYGYNTESITQLLNGSHNDSQGNAVLNLENHSITIEGVAVANLKASQFFV